MNKEQLELGFTQNVVTIKVRRQRAQRARWWFAQMRHAVDSALDWRSGAPGRPEQIPLLPARHPWAA